MEWKKWKKIERRIKWIKQERKTKNGEKKITDWKNQIWKRIEKKERERETMKKRKKNIKSWKKERKKIK